MEADRIVWGASLVCVAVALVRLGRSVSAFAGNGLPPVGLWASGTAGKLAYAVAFLALVATCLVATKAATPFPRTFFFNAVTVMALCELAADKLDARRWAACGLALGAIALFLGLSVGGWMGG